MKTTLTVITLLSLACLAQSAPNDPDFQLRALAHFQLSITNGQAVAGWLVAPDLTKTEPARFLAVGGWLFKEEENWKEIMAGGLFGTDGSVQPVLNLRSYSKTKQSDFYADLLLKPDRCVASSYATFPVSKFRLGLETELTAGLNSGVKGDARLGPRLSFKIPGADRLTITTSATFGIRGDTTIRTYLLYNFSKR
ncbi:MAG: hypothetical protein Q7K35_05435 [bacterium]|nr:hypothetical protein [bacterium]